MKIGYLMEVGEEIRKPPYNGPANHVRQVVTEFNRRGHETIILFRLERKLWISRDLERYDQVSVRSMDQGALRWLERFIRRTQTVLGLPFIGYFESLRFALACRQELPDCDIYLERLSWMKYGGVLASRRQGIPLVLEYNGDPQADLKAKGTAPQGFQSWISRKILGWTLAQAEHVIATGEGWKKSCIETWGVPESKVTVVENGTDLVNIISREQLRSFQTTLKDSECTRLVYLGGFYRWHGIQVLLRAVRRAVDQGINLHLTLIGSGDGFDEARSLAQELQLDGQVLFAGKLAADAYAPLLADSDIGLSPYCGWEEFSGLKIFDYKAAGLACIASGKDGQPTTLSHGQSGWIVPPCDEDALLEAIIKFSRDRDLRRQMGQKARLEAEQIHSWEHTADQIEKILVGLIRE